MNPKYKEKQLIWIVVLANVFFIFIISLAILLLESEFNYFFGITMILLLIVIDFIIVNHIKGEKISYKGKSEQNGIINNYQIKYKGSIYSFSDESLVLYPLGIVILSFLIIGYFDHEINFWLHEITVKPTIFFINLFFNLGAETSYLPEFTYPWHIDIPGSVGVYFVLGCTGLPGMAILSSLVIFTPHPQDFKTKEDILWRKLKSFIATLISLYILTLIRLIIIIYLYHLGFEWDLLHNSLASLSALIAAHVFILCFCNRFIPEWYISIYYMIRLVNPKIKDNRITKK